MTVIENIPSGVRLTALRMLGEVRAEAPVQRSSRVSRPRTGPVRRRPPGAPLRYRGAGVPISRTSHRRRVVSPAATVGLAMLAALITVWLGLEAQFGAAANGISANGVGVPDQLGVVQVQAGEDLQQLAARVAPGASTGYVVTRIRELNDLGSAALDAGQTLIAPIG